MSPHKKIYIIAGEASGDSHGALLIQELIKQNPNVECRGWGGDLLKSAGVKIDIRYESANFMGFSEVIKNLHKIWTLFRTTKKNILEFAPDAIILIDYPGFNLRMAKWCKERGIKVFYYIAPQVWAWKEKRVDIIKKYVDRLFVILPFEKEYFEKQNYSVSYYGHPLLERMKQFSFTPHFRELHQLNCQAIIAILPGSRSQEIKTLLPIYLKAMANERKHQLVIAGLRQHENIYREIISRFPSNVRIVYNDLYTILHHAKFALVTSGTATLETALYNVPQVVCYKGNKLSYLLARKLVKVKFISLVNLIADRQIVPELIQDDCNPANIEQQWKTLEHGTDRMQMKENYHSLKTLISGGNTSFQIANEINHYLSLP